MAEVLERKEKRPRFNWVINLFFVLVGSMLFLFANSAYWFNRYIFDSKNFTQITTSALNSESSRNAIATEIVERALKDRPVLKNVISEPVTKLVSGLLGTDLAERGVESTVSRLHTVATTENPESVQIDLTSVKELVVGITNLLEARGRFPEQERVNVSQIPDSIVLVEKEAVPNIYQFGTTLLWLGPIAFLGGLIFFLIPLFRNFGQRSLFSLVLGLEGLGLLLSGFFALVLGPLFKPALLNQIENGSMRIVAGNIYEAFVQKFNEQTLIIIIMGITLLAIASANYWFRVRN